VVYGGREIGISGVRAMVKRLTTQDPELPVIIQADRGSLSETLVRVVDEAKLGGAKGVSVATEKT
jgi:biopolymer transport protein ExbD